MDKLNPKIIKRKAVKDGIRGRDIYYDPVSQQIELKSNPPEHVSSSDLKVGSPEHKKKNPQLYGYRYVSKLSQALHPKLGTAPEEIEAAKKIINEQYKDPTSISADEIKYLKPKSLEIKKAPTYFPTNERIAETPPPNFETPVDPLLKGLGSFLVTNGYSTRKD